MRKTFRLLLLWPWASLNAEQLRQSNSGIESALDISGQMAELTAKYVNTLKGLNGKPARPSAIPLPAAPVRIPSFEEIVVGIRPGSQLVLGVVLATGEVIHGTFKKLYSSFI